MVKTLTVVTVSVDPEFQALCPQPTTEERAHLRRLITDAGGCDDLLVWNTEGYPVLDGHTRYDICNGEGIRYGTKLIDLSSREAAIDFIARIQLGRRNISEEQKSYLRGKLYSQQKESHGGDRHRTPQSERSSGQNVHLNSEPKNTAQTLAEETGVTEKTIRRDEQFADAVDALAAKSPALARAARVGIIPKSSVPALAAASQSTIDRLTAIDNPAELRKAIKKFVDAKASRNSEPKRTVPERAPTSADEAKTQIKIWADTIGRWLGQSPSIDELRGKFPGKQGDSVVGHATALFESLKIWEKAIR